MDNNMICFNLDIKWMEQ